MKIQVREKVDIVNKKINELSGLYHYAANQAGISDGELSIWSVLLNSKEEYSQQDLCEMLCLPKQTINSLISGFVKKEYVILEHVAGTRNKKVIRLTDEGKKAGRDKTEWIFEAEELAMAETTSKEIEMAIILLEKYITHFQAAIETKSRADTRNPLH